MQLPRMTTRRWMVAIAIVGLVLGGAIGEYRLKRRRDAFLDRARNEEWWVQTHTGQLSGQMGSPSEGLLLEAIDYEAAMVRKYERAARFPWLPVERDPPAQGGTHAMIKFAERPPDSLSKQAKAGASGEP